MTRTRGGKKEGKLLTWQHEYAQRTVSANQSKAIQGDIKFTECPVPMTYANVATTTDNSTTIEHKDKGVSNLTS